MATYPANVVVFSTHVNLTETIDASHPNNIQAEVVAIENTVGTNPHISTTPSSSGSFTSTSTTYANLTGRLANIETGIVSDAHTHYLHKAGGDTIQSSAVGVVGLTYKAITSQTADFVQFRDALNNVLAKVDVAGNLTAVAGTFSSAITSSGNTVLTTTHSATSSGTHGITGSFVGTTDTQTLANKTLNSPQFQGTTLGLVATGAALNSTSTIGGVSGSTILADHSAWTSYTGAAGTNTTVSLAKYMLMGKTLFFRIEGTFTGGPTGAQIGGLNLPNSLLASDISQIIPMVYTNPGVSPNVGFAIPTNSFTSHLDIYSVGNAFATNSTFTVQGVIEVQ